MTPRYAANVVWGVALGAVALVYFANYAIWKGLERTGSFPHEPGVLATQCIIIASPFIALALIVSMRARSSMSAPSQSVPGAGTAAPVVFAALKGLIITALVYSLLWYDAVSAHQSGGGKGANIGLGILALLSPILVAFVLHRGYRRVQWDKL